MTAAELEKLLAEVTPDWCIYGEPDVGLPPSLFARTPGMSGFQPIEPLQGHDLTLAAMAPTLARRAIAAEKLAEALRMTDAVLSGANMDMKAVWRKTQEALAAYEAAK